MNKWIAILLLMLSVNSYGQADELYDHDLNKSKWQEMREGIRYEGNPDGPGREWTYESREDYEKALEKYRERTGKDGTGSDGERDEKNGDGSGRDEYNQRNNYQPDRNSTPPTSINVNPNANGLGAVGYILIGVFIIGLAFLVYYLFLNIERKGNKIVGGGVIDFDVVNPTEIPVSELQRLLNEAIGAGDYRGAIRIYFIFIVRDLSEKGVIDWQKEKTNVHYLRELSGNTIFDDFNKAVSYFEVVWYGKREIDDEKFEMLKPIFTGLLTKLEIN